MVDRLNASLLGQQATRALISGVSNVVFSLKRGAPVSVNLHDAVTKQKHLDPEYLRMAEALA